MVFFKCRCAKMIPLETLYKMINVQVFLQSLSPLSRAVVAHDSSVLHTGSISSWKLSFVSLILSVAHFRDSTENEGSCPFTFGTAWNSSFRARYQVAFSKIFRQDVGIPQIPTEDSQRDRHVIAALGSLSSLLCYYMVLFLKPPTCFFALPCLSEDFTQEFSAASWIYGYF